ncbi:MAG: hypothetical protein IKV64_04810 [Clostridia bacterium]|nr:hypothetical protein [Clostridia bacterium]
MILDVDYPPSNATVTQLQSWCVMLLDELNLAFNKINEGTVLGDDEKLINWK